MYIEILRALLTWHNATITSNCFQFQIIIHRPTALRSPAYRCPFFHHQFIASCTCNSCTNTSCGCSDVFDVNALAIKYHFQFYALCLQALMSSSLLYYPPNRIFSIRKQTTHHNSSTPPPSKHRKEPEGYFQ